MQNTSSAEETASASQELDRQSSNLKKVISSFRIKEEEDGGDSLATSSQTALLPGPRA